MPGEGVLLGNRHRQMKKEKRNSLLLCSVVDLTDGFDESKEEMPANLGKTHGWQAFFVLCATVKNQSGNQISAFVFIDTSTESNCAFGCIQTVTNGCAIVFVYRL